METRLKHLIGKVQNWIPSAYTLRTSTDPRKVISHKAAIIKKLSMGPYAHLFDGLFEVELQDTFDKICGVMQDILTWNYDAHDDVEAELQAKTILRERHIQVLRVVCQSEKFLPASLFTISFHALLHLPTFSFKWNHVRNFWCFFNERCYIFPSLLLPSKSS